MDTTTKATVPGDFFKHIHNALEILDPDSERPRATIRKALKELQRADAILGGIIAQKQAEAAAANGDIH